MPQRAQGPQLRRPVRELADGVVDLHLHPALVGRVHVRLHLRGSQEGVVDPGVDRRGVVDVDHVRAGRRDLVERGVAVVEARAPLGVRVDGLEGGEGQAEVVALRLALLHPPRAGAAPDEVRPALLAETAGALPAIAPRRGQDERLLQVEIGVERPLVAVVLERDLDAGVDVAHPDRVLVLLRHVPGPLETVGPRAALPAEAHRVAGHVRPERHLEADVVQGHGRVGFQRDLVLDRSVELDPPVDGGGEHAGPARRLPLGRALRLPGHLRTVVRPRKPRAIRTLDDERDGRGQQLARRARGRGHLRSEAAADRSRKARRVELDRAAEDRERAALRHDRRVRRHQAVVLGEARVEPAQAREAPGLVVAGGGNGRA